MHYAKHRHLRGGAYALHFVAHRHDANLIPVALGHAGGPGRKLGAGPLEAVVVVAEVTRVELLEELVVVGIGRGDEGGGAALVWLAAATGAQRHHLAPEHGFVEGLCYEVIHASG